MNQPRHIAHIVHRFATGGLENGIVNLINHLPESRYRHSILCLAGYDPEFAARLRPEVRIESIDKQPGPDWRYFPAMWRLLRRLRPDVVHTRNLATMEYQIPALLAGVPRRIHGEHGWDMADLNGSNARFVTLKRALRPLVHDFIALSSQSREYLVERVKVAPGHCHQIINGVDTDRFTPVGDAASAPRPGFITAHTRVFGCVGRLATVKNHRMLAEAFIALCRALPDQAEDLRLVIVGDGEHREALQQRFDAAGVADRVWLTGSRGDIPELMRLFDLFVLPSLAEGISNTILEALASGLPVIATEVGGNPELVSDGLNGRLVPCTVEGLTAAMTEYCLNEATIDHQGREARRTAEVHFSLETMVANYSSLYQAS